MLQARNCDAQPEHVVAASLQGERALQGDSCNSHLLRVQIRLGHEIEYVATIANKVTSAARLVCMYVDLNLGRIRKDNDNSTGSLMT